MSESSIKSINKSLSDHELIKVKVKIGDKKSLGSIIQKKTSCEIVGSIGKVLILYKRSENDKGFISSSLFDWTCLKMPRAIK